jgi:2-(1,2-epoxy-1,2-dihydrophenyl)acetyl-CoA isomerase
MDMMYTGRLVSADEALAIGLVRRVVPHERLMDEVMAYAEQIAAQPPIAVQFAKRALTRSLDSALLAQLELEWSYQVAALTPTTHTRASPRSASEGHPASAAVKQAPTPPA